MPTTRSILRGTFRVSIALAVLAAAYASYANWTSPATIGPESAATHVISFALLVLIVVNLLGLTFVALRAVVRLIASGFRPAN